MIDRYLTAEIEKEEASAEIGETKVIGNLQGHYIPAPNFAKIGQTIVVEEVDKNGRPTKWKPSDIGSFTDADKSQIVQSVLDSLPTWEGGSY